MDDTISQITLVDHPIFLLFSSSTLEGTDVSLSTDPQRVLYSVRSPLPSGSSTICVYKLDDSGRASIAATIKERALLSDTITFEEPLAFGSPNPKVKVDKWMRKDTARERTFWRAIDLENDLTVYWKASSQYRLALYDSRSPDRPIAIYPHPYGSKSLVATSQSEIALHFLWRHDALCEHLLEVLLSFIILERKLRDYEREGCLLMNMAMVPPEVVPEPESPC